MLTQRLINNPDGSATLTIDALPPAVPELMGLAEELGLRSTIQTEGSIHILNEPEEPMIP